MPGHEVMFKLYMIRSQGLFKTKTKTLLPTYNYTNYIHSGRLRDRTPRNGLFATVQLVHNYCPFVGIRFVHPGSASFLLGRQYLPNFGAFKPDSQSTKVP